MKNKGFALLRVQLLGLFGLNRLLHSKDPRENPATSCSPWAWP